MIGTGDYIWVSWWDQPKLPARVVGRARPEPGRVTSFLVTYLSEKGWVYRYAQGPSTTVSYSQARPMTPLEALAWAGDLRGPT